MKTITNITIGLLALLSLSALSTSLCRAQTQPNITFKIDTREGKIGEKRYFEMCLSVKGEWRIEGIEKPSDWQNNKCVVYKLPYTSPDIVTIKIWGEVERFSIYMASVVDLDVSQSPSLISLGCEGNALTNLNLSSNTHLKTLFCRDNQLTVLDLTANTALEHLNCSGNPLTELNLKPLTLLKSFRADRTQISKLDVSTLGFLEYLIANSNKKLEEVIFHSGEQKAEKLREVHLVNCALKGLDFTGLDNLYSVFCYDNQINGEACSALIKSLPDHSYPHPIHNNKLRIINTGSTTERNVCYEADAKLAWEKEWECEDYNGGNPQRYEGSKPSAGVAIEASTLEVFPNPTKKEL
ncbi:leucine-rich repeat domain-containing protein, partial [Porphyromonas circumdentaria]